VSDIKDTESDDCCRFLGHYGRYCPLLRKDCDQPDWTTAQADCPSYKKAIK